MGRYVKIPGKNICGIRGSRLLPLLFSLACLLILPACAPAGGEDPAPELPPEPEEGVLIYAALNPVTPAVQSSVNQFNKTHEDVQIEVRDYSDEGGIQRLQLELVAGRVPDVIELRKVSERVNPYFTNVIRDGVTRDEYWMPYRQLVQKGYLEDLWPYIENDPDLGRDAVLEEPLKAAEVNGGLYMLFQDVCITTLMAPENLVGERDGWTFEELMDVFSAMPPDSTILRYDSTRRDVYNNLLRFGLDQYVDWETREAYFDSPSFRSILEFLGTFPEEFETLYAPEQLEEEIIWRITNGRQLLEGIVVATMENITYNDSFWGGTARYIGYPTADGEAGSMFVPQETVLAMSSTCQNKEAAWDYMRQLITSRYTISTMKRAHNLGTISIPVNRADYETGNKADIIRGNSLDLVKDPEAMPPWKPFSNGIQIFPKHVPNEEDAQRLDALIHSTTLLYWPDDALSDIVWDAIGPYFAGDKTMDETVQLINNRVRLYLNENR